MIAQRTLNKCIYSTVTSMVIIHLLSHLCHPRDCYPQYSYNFVLVWRLSSWYGSCALGSHLGGELR